MIEPAAQKLIDDARRVGKKTVDEWLVSRNIKNEIGMRPVDDIDIVCLKNLIGNVVSEIQKGWINKIDTLYKQWKNQKK